MLTARDWGRLLGCKVERQLSSGSEVDGQRWRGYGTLSVDLLSQITRAIDRGQEVPLKPVLRTFDQMTEEERVYFLSEFGSVYDDDIPSYRIRKANNVKEIDYLDSIHVDQRGWIDQGLAIKEGE